MTPVRAKRNSKAPNRFSSDNSRIETTKSTGGETTTIYDNKAITMTDDLTTTKSTVKIKPIFKEPLKVKLPKLKRPHLQSNEHRRSDSNKSTLIEQVKIHKIKLPFSVKKLSTKQANSTETKVKHQNSIDVPKTDLKKSPPRVEAKLESEGHKLSPFKEPAQRMDFTVSQSGGPNNLGIRCPCGVDDDLGVMVECENCATWQHGHCINVGSEDDAYEGYICAYCIMPQDKVSDSLRYLTVGDKFQSRFDALDALRQKVVNQHDSELKNPNSPGKSPKDTLLEEATENNAILTLNELSKSVNDLNRVMRSLKMKWRLYTSAAYETELRIWQNPVWSDEKPLESDKTFYFMHRCKANLRLNLCNMITRLGNRFKLIEYAIPLARQQVMKNNFGQLNPDDEKKLEEAQRFLESANVTIGELKLKLADEDLSYFNPGFDSN